MLLKGTIRARLQKTTGRGEGSMPVSLWAVRWTRPLTEEEAAALTDLLPSARRERLSRLKSPEKRQEALCAYGLLLLALRRLKNWTDFPETALNDGGKPFFPDCPDVQFSVSHTAGAALAAVSGQLVGVDIEQIRPLRQAFMRKLMGVEDQDVFFRSWVRREARTKCTGAGIGSMLRTEPPMEAGEFYQEADVFPGYQAGVAYRGSGPIKLARLELEDLIGGLL